MLPGKLPQHHRPGLSHIQGVKVSLHGDVEHVGAALDDAGAQSLIFIAQHQNGWQGQGICKSVQGVAAGADACAHDGQARLLGLVKSMTQIGHLGHWKTVQSTSSGAARGTAQKGAVVLGQEQARAPQCVECAGQGAHIAGVLHLVEGQQQGQRRSKGGGQNFGQADAGCFGEAGDHALMLGRAHVIEHLGLNQRKAQRGLAADVQHEGSFAGVQSFFEKEGVHPPGFTLQKFQNWLDAGEKWCGRFLAGLGAVRLRARGRWSHGVSVIPAKPVVKSCELRVITGVKSMSVMTCAECKHHSGGVPMSNVLSITKAHAWRRRLFPAVLAALLLMGGCSLRQGGTASQTPPPEIPSYAAGDDGISLTPAEMKALQSTGQLDKSLSPAAQEQVGGQFKFFLHKGRTTMGRFSQRSEAYLSQARKVFRERGMPEELAYLAMVESGYNAKAVSHAGAAGAWQFMPYTGMKYGLNQDWWMDERLDPYKSAEAAADYLNKLYGDFRDWHLAIAAYNAGEGKISRALEGTRAKTFFELVEKNHMLDGKAQLREETKNYVPRFLAFCKIMRNLSPLGFQSVDVNKPTAVARVEARPGTDLQALAAAVNMSWAEFSSQNMAHKRHVTHADRSTYVYVPSQSRSAAVASIKGGRKGNGWKSYVAAKGDSWQKLSQKTGIPVSALQASNRQMASLRPGASVNLPGWAELRVPSSVSRTELADAGSRGTRGGKAYAGKNSTKAAAGAARTYRLESGDTLTAVAREHNTTVNDLMALNDLDDASKVRAGQMLLVPGKAASEPERAVAQNTRSTMQAGKAVAQSRPAVEHGSTGSLGKSAPASSAAKVVKQETYTVQPGDTLWGIARKHNLSTQELLDLNVSAGKTTLRPGSRLLVSEQR